MQHIMIDLEMNQFKKRMRGEKRLSSELIEIGAVRMDSSFEILEKYQAYVLPEFVTMEARITRLTGITDDMLKGAPHFAAAMDDFAAWIGKGDHLFYSWSMSDLQQILHEADYKEYQHPILKQMQEKWIDFQAVYSNLLGITQKIKLKDAVSSADYKFTGDAHTALADAVNTAEILRLSKNPEKFEHVMKPLLDLLSPKKEESTLLDMCPDFFAEFNKQQGKQ